MCPASSQTATCEQDCLGREQSARTYAQLCAHACAHLSVLESRTYHVAKSAAKLAATREEKARLTQSLSTKDGGGDGNATWPYLSRRAFERHMHPWTETTMKFEKLKVRPKKLASKAPCAAEFASVLACWASTQDLRSQSECVGVTKTLRECMATAVR